MRPIAIVIEVYRKQLRISIISLYPAPRCAPRSKTGTDAERPAAGPTAVGLPQGKRGEQSPSASSAGPPECREDGGPDAPCTSCTPLHRNGPQRPSGGPVPRGGLRDRSPSEWSAGVLPRSLFARSPIAGSISSLGRGAIRRGSTAQLCMSGAGAPREPHARTSREATARDGPSWRPRDGRSKWAPAGPRARPIEGSSDEASYKINTGGADRGPPKWGRPTGAATRRGTERRSTDIKAYPSP